ncbi:MAG TPA: M1 family aminopeptidase [Lacibacter sp.]|nr:M1 family aminopeptidase [Lacibacter sp.]
MKQLLIIFSIVVTGIVNAQQNRLSNLTYTIKVLPKAGQFRIVLEFIAGNESSTVIQLPKQFGSFTNAFRYVTIQKGLNIESVSYNGSDSSVVLLQHKPGQRINFDYLLKNALTDSLPGRQPAYSIIIKPNYFNIAGHVFFAYPKKDSAKAVNIKINWLNFPKGWSNINSFGYNYATQTLPGIPMPLFVSSIWCGGDFRVYPFTVNQKPVYFALRGKWRFKDRDMLQMIQQTIAAQRSFWNDYNINHYTVTLMPFLTENEFSYSYQGTGLTNSFATWATNNKQTSPSGLMYLYNHELMHHWIGNMIENEQPEELHYWFSEGFTDYFTWKNMLESRFITKAEYHRSFDSILTVHYSNPLHTIGNNRIREEFWTNDQVQKLPYNRGRIFAFYLDTLLIKQTIGKVNLKKIMVELLQLCRTQQRKFNSQLLIDVVKQMANYDISELIEKFIIQGIYISLEEWNSIIPEGFEYKEVSLFAIGFTTDKVGLALNATVTSLDEHSNAAKAGILVGDIIKGYNLTYNPSQEGEITVQRGKELIKIKFYPAKKEKLLQLK